MKKTLFITALFILCGFCITALANTGVLSTIDVQARLLSQKAKELDPQILKLGLKAYLKAREQGFDQQQVLTIIDYSKPSRVPRMWVFDLKQKDVLFKEWVAHGKKSGDDVATNFSDQIGSEKSSIGVFVTGNTYVGRHGLSLKLNGLEKGFNENAMARAIVVHAADYVNPSIAKEQGRIGRSWGCPAVRPIVAKPIINTIKNGTVIFAYYPDKKWLQVSEFINSQS